MNRNVTSTSTKSHSKQRRQKRRLLASIVGVLIISLGTFSAVIAAKWTPRLGLDLAGGLSVVYQTDHHVSASDLEETVAILNNRVNGIGVSGAQVETTGTDQITVSIPGLKDPTAVESAIGQTARLSFRPVLCYAPPYIPTKNGHRSASAALPGALPSSCPTPFQLVTSNLSGSAQSSNGVYYAVGADPVLAAHPDSTSDASSAVVLQAGLPGSGFKGRYLEGPAELSGTAVKNASAQLSPTGRWVVDITLTGSGSNGWNHMTARYFHEIIGIELDGVVQSAPITQPTQGTWSSFDGQVEISGGFTQQGAENLAIALRYGSLPVGLKQLTSQSLSPTLGRASLVAGLGAGIAGLALVLLYVLAYYRALGLVVISGLAVTAACLWAIIAWLGQTSVAPSFDLAGITGLIVSIGITVDSYIVYFERLKDETRSGRTVRTSVERGFKSAWGTVWAADLVSLLAAIVLYQVAVGDVKGFAFFLGLSTILDMAVTWFYTRPLVLLLGQRGGVADGGRFGISRGLGAPTHRAVEEVGS